METAKEHFDREVERIIQRTYILNHLKEPQQQKYLEAEKMIEIGFNGLRAADRLDKENYDPNNPKKASAFNAMRKVSLDLLLEGSITRMQLESELPQKQPTL